MIKLIINRALIAIDALFTNLLNKFKRNNNNKEILIVFQQVFGDSIILSNSIERYTNIFPRKEGYKITLVARSYIINFINEVLPQIEKIQKEPIDFKRFLEDYPYYRKIKNRYSSDYGIVIVPGTSLSGEILASICTARRRIGLVRSYPIKWPLVMRIFSNLAYTEKVVPSKKLMMLQRHRLLLNYLGDRSYQASLPKLLPQDKVIKDDKYCVICPGASSYVKCWPIERYAAIVDYIIEKYNYTIYLCGGTDEKKYEEKLIQLVKNKKAIISFIGKSNFKEWSSIVQYASLVLGNDSATMHLAAASRRRAICIAGVYDKFQFFPYKVDYLKENDRLPITVFHDKKCAWCRTVGYFAGYGNKICKKQIDSGKCALCIDEISIKEVKSAIDNIMKKEAEESI